MTTNKKSTHHDPAKKRLEQKSPGELICKYCHAIYQNKRWQPLEKLEARLIDRFKQGVCPACHLERGHLSDGVLHLGGAILTAHHDEIKNLIHNIAEKEEARNIENRIERIEEKTGEITVYTGKNQLAVELGKKINDAYKGGVLEITWSKEDKPAEVRWHGK